MIKPHCCPVCDKQIAGSPATSQADFPFCSPRCREVDLFRWSSGRYAIVEDVDPEVAEFLKEDPDIMVQGEGMDGEKY